MNRNIPSPNRRSLLKALAASPALLTPMLLGSNSLRAAPASAGAGLIADNVCRLSPEATKGPYYIDPKLVRADITENRPGLPLEMRLQVVAADCRPIAGARVDIWHCDAAGNYSGFARQGSDAVSDTAGQTFLRGTQMADTGGVVRFRTIWPGWYRGRATHIHYKVFLDERTVLTSQLFFPEDVNDAVYRTAAPYAARGGRRETFNGNDWIARRAGAAAMAKVEKAEGGYAATLVVGIDPGAVRS